MDTLSNDDIAAAGLADWRKLAQGLHARFRADDRAGAARFVAALAESDLDVLDVRWRERTVDVVAATHVDGTWVTADDVSIALAVSELAAGHGLTPAPSEVTQLELALDTAHQDTLTPFWSALLTGGESVVHGEVHDPTGRVPVTWFQPADDVPASPQRWHFDIWIAPDVLDERIAAAVAAGGTLLENHGTFTVLADSDGNRACLCVSTGR